MSGYLGMSDSLPAPQWEAHIAHLSSQMAVVGQSMQQVEMQLIMQQKQHEDLMKLLVNCMAPQDRYSAQSPGAPRGPYWAYCLGPRGPCFAEMMWELTHMFTRLGDRKRFM